MVSSPGICIENVDAPLRRRRSPPLRVALYSPGLVGLGHMRRNLLVAQALTGSAVPVTALILAEAREVSALAMPPGVDCVSLPAQLRSANGRISPRYLGVPSEDLLRLRARTIRAVLEAFEPDVFIADHLPRGAGGELDEALRVLSSRPATRSVLGLRDILDDSETAMREWWNAGNVASVRDHYDAVWIYGDPVVYDAVSAYRLPPDVSSKVRFTGYMDHGARRTAAAETHAELPEEPFSLCLLGGGYDGAPLAKAFVRSELPPGSTGVVLAGPYMPAPDRERLEKLAASRPRFRVLDFLGGPEHLLARADRVVSMGGYNTTLEILSFGKHALLVPRVRPRREQWIRAKRLEELGLVDVLAPDALTPEALSTWLAAEPPRRPAGAKVRLDGMKRLPELFEDVLEGRHEHIGCHTA